MASRWGGHIVVASLELRPGLYQGGLAECGLVDGIGIADYLMAYTAAAELISGVPLLDAPDQDTFARILNERAVPALGMPGPYTPRGRRVEREPRIRGTDWPADGAAHHAARDRRRVGAAQPRAVVPAPHDRGRDRPPAGAACDPRAQSLRRRRGDA